MRAVRVGAGGEGSVKAVRALLILVAGLSAACTCGADEGAHEHGGDDHGHAHGEGEHGHEDDHGHAHGEGAVSITRWTDRFELFAEHPPAVVGETVPFLAHVTILDGFQPVTEGSVTLVLEGPQRIAAEHDRPLRPGIFSPRFIPRTPGTYEARLEVRTPELEGTIGGFPIEVYASAEAAAAATAGAEESGDAVSFLKEQQWQVPFATVFAERRPLVPTVEVAGEVTTPPGGTAQVGAQVAGRIVAPPGGLPRPGDTVREGQLLATIAPAPSSPEASANAGLAVAEAQARAAAARSNLARAERLIADRAISERELEEARREVEVAAEAVRAAQQAAALFRGAASGRGAGTWRLTAPIAGVLTEVSANPGEPVSPDDVLFRIVDPTELWIAARVPEQDAARIRSDADASYEIPGHDRWHALDVTGEDANASLVNVARTVDRDSRTVGVVYQLADPSEQLRVGGVVRVAIPVGEARELVAVPSSAVLVVEGRDVVYVQVEGESFEERTVRIGPRAGAFVGIERGVEPGERVVSEGANLVRLSSRTTTGGHGHVH